MLYSSVKYYLENDQWTTINESIGTQNCLPAYSYCVDRNLYQAHFSSGSVKVIDNANHLTMTPISLSTAGLTIPYSQPAMVVSDNSITYQNVFGNNDLRFTYTPEQLKKEFILESMPNTQGATLTLTFRLAYPANTQLSSNNIQYHSALNTINNPLVSNQPIGIQTNNHTSFILNTPFAYDSNGSNILLGYQLYEQNGQTYAGLRIPVSWLLNATYPVIIDPTVTLNASNITWDGFVYLDQLAADGDLAYIRGGSPDPLLVGHELGVSGSPDNIYRSVIQFDTSSIPDSAIIQKINLTINVTSLGSPDNSNISVHHMEKNNSQYDAGQIYCEGNCQFWTDMGNGTTYKNVVATTNQNIIDVSNSTIDFQNRLGANWMAYGLTSHLGESNTTGKLTVTYIASKSHSIPNNRPYLTVQYYIVANETSGRNAIDLGINQSVLGQSNPRDADQLIYLVNKNNNQYRGTFDKFTDRYNQSWVFNYVTIWDAFTNIPSLFNVLNVWENTSLSEEDIAGQVATFINSTIA